MIGDPAGICILLADLPPGLVHQQPIQNVGRFAYGGRNVLGRERSELVGDMGIGLEAWLGTVFCVDEVQDFGQQHRQHADLVFVGCAGLRTCEGFREAGICINFLYQFGDPYDGQPVVEVEHQFVRLSRLKAR